MRRAGAPPGRCAKLFASLLVAIGVAIAVDAHVVYQRRSLRGWAQQADVAVVAETLSGLRVWSSPDRSDHQEYFQVRIVRSLDGDTALPETLDVFPHSEGEPRYEVGERILLFLDRTAARAEFAHLAVRFPYFTTQGAGHEWILEADDREVEAVATAWRRLRGDASYPPVRDLLARQLASKYPRLRAEAIADLLGLADRKEFLADREFHEQLASLLRSPGLRVAEKIGVIDVLSHTEPFSSADAILRLAASVDDRPERVDVIRAAGKVRDRRVTSWLRDRLSEPDTAIQDAALLALGRPWHGEAVGDIARIASDQATPVRVGTTAVRALGRIGTPDAKRALRALAELERAPLSGLARSELARVARTPATGGNAARPARMPPRR